MTKKCRRCDHPLIGSEQRGNICNECLDAGYGPDDDIMGRARRNLTWVNQVDTRRDPGVELAGFLDFMHPEMSEDRKRALIHAIRHPESE